MHPSLLFFYHLLWQKLSIPRSVNFLGVENPGRPSCYEIHVLLFLFQDVDNPQVPIHPYSLAGLDLRSAFETTGNTGYPILTSHDHRVREGSPAIGDETLDNAEGHRPGSRGSRGY